MDEFVGRAGGGGVDGDASGGACGWAAADNAPGDALTDDGHRLLGCARSVSAAAAYSLYWPRPVLLPETSLGLGCQH